MSTVAENTNESVPPTTLLTTQTSGNLIGDIEVKLLSEVLKMNTTLTKLVLFSGYTF